MTRVTVAAPTRIADLGGWTDTWFARRGAVCHLAVWPGVEVTLGRHDGPPGVQVRTRNFDRRWHWAPGTAASACPDPLIAACLDDAGVPEGAWLLEVGSQVPPGASMGTSASLCVATLAALHCVGAGRGDATPADAASLARRAHAVETARLQQQSGVQDQWAAAAGGAGLIEVLAYPEARRLDVRLALATRAALERQLLVVLLPHGHDSSAVHAQVVEALATSGPDDARLVRLRQCARDGAAALGRGDLEGYGQALVANTEAQAALHPSIVNEQARQLIARVRGGGAWGWKVNGAGGDGGSLTVLAGSGGNRRDLVAGLRETCPWARVLDVRLAATGVVVTGAPP